jgi:hypothetical protein
MWRVRRAVFTLLTGAAVIVGFGLTANAQTQYPKPTDLPNPYRLVEGWPTIPQDMNGGRWGEVIRVHVARDGNIWVFHRCFNTVPPGSAVCINRGPANPPILEFDPAGRLLKSFGVGLFAYPHGFTVDQDGNLWATDVNDAEVVLGMSARNATGVVMGQEVLKLSPNGQVLMTLGREGVSGNGPDRFDRPTDQDGKFIAAWRPQPAQIRQGQIAAWSRMQCIRAGRVRIVLWRLASVEHAVIPHHTHTTKSRTRWH